METGHVETRTQQSARGNADTAVWRVLTSVEVAYRELRLSEFCSSNVFDVGQDQYAAVPLSDRIGSDLGEYQTLASTSGQNRDGVVVAVSQVIINGVDGILLVASQLHLSPPAW